VQLLELPEATRFSDEPDLRDAVYVIQQLKQQPQFLGELRKRLGAIAGVTDPLDVYTRPGPKRGVRAKGGAGDYVLLFLAYLLLRKTAMFALVDQPHAFEAIWRECGFTEAPDYQTMRNRFIELEEHWRAFAAVGDLAIQQARRHRPEIGRFVHVDACAWETHARLEHCCPRDRNCKRAHWYRRASADTIKERRNEEQELPVDEQPPSLAGRTNIEIDDVPDELVPPGGLDKRYSYYLVDSCLFRCRDRDVGFRIYRRGTEGEPDKTWLGGYGMTAVDHLTGAPLAVEAFEADGWEAGRYEPLQQAMIRAVGKDVVLATTGDKGLSYSDVFELNTKERIASVFPWRPKGRSQTQREWVRCALYDEYGCPRCQFCGGEGNQMLPSHGLEIDRNGKPIIRFRCSAPWHPECWKVQTIRCSEDWTMLLPLSRLHPLYYDLHATHFAVSERMHSLWRSRYHVFGDDKTMRLKRWSRSLAAQRLRAQAARFLEWFRLCLRHGWIAGHNRIRDEEPFSRNGSGGHSYQGMLVNRRKLHLHIPYGEAAIRSGLKRAGPSPPAVLPDGSILF
jgi:hypothetical protein